MGTTRLLRRETVSLMLIVAVCQTIVAHDVWLEPSNFAPALNTAVRVHLRVGDRFAGEPLARNEAKIERFVSIAPDGVERPIAGRDGTDPAGIVRFDAPGLWILGYRGKPSSVTLASAAFESYLDEEGLQPISRERERRGETGKPGRENFSRSVKTLLRAGSPDPAALTGYDREVGLPMEIIPEANPFAPGLTELPIRLMFLNEPLEGALIVAMRRVSRASSAEVVSSVRSDAAGRAVLRIAPGLWLIKAVHMVRARPESGIDWESTWTSMTFEIATEGPR